jgi:hypothetical protein
VRWRIEQVARVKAVFSRRWKALQSAEWAFCWLPGWFCLLSVFLFFCDFWIPVLAKASSLWLLDHSLDYVSLVLPQLSFHSSELSQR